MTEQQPERPARYQRSANGLIGALVVTLLAIGAFVAFRAFSREELEVRPEAVAYLPVVAQAQAAGQRPAYPATLPDGWIVTSVNVARGEAPAWALGLLTSEGEYAGLRQSDAPVDSLLETYVDAEPVEGEPFTLPGALAPSWRTFADSGGDRAYAADVDGQTVLVYGSASQADLETLIGLLTTDPAPDPGS